LRGQGALEYLGRAFHYACPWVSAKRPWDYDSQLEQQQREGHEERARYGYQQPLPQSLFRQRSPIEHDQLRRVEVITNPPPEEAMINNTTGSMPVRMMIEPMVIMDHTTVR
jgi:hypothetical protein